MCSSTRDAHFSVLNGLVGQNKELYHTCCETRTAWIACVCLCACYCFPNLFIFGISTTFIKLCVLEGEGNYDTFGWHYLIVQPYRSESHIIKHQQRTQTKMFSIYNQRSDDDAAVSIHFLSVYSSPQIFCLCYITQVAKCYSETDNKLMGLMK